MCLKLNPDAIFIADSHFNPLNARELLDYLNHLQATPPSQLFLMGDIAQILLGNLKSSLKSNYELLIALDHLEKTGVQIIWLEGNHDFFLSAIKKSNLLQKTQFIPRNKQPISVKYQDKIYLLAHGDKFLNLTYELYIKALTHIPKLLEFIDYLSAGEVYLEIEKKLNDKPITRHCFHFFEFASKRIEAYRQLQIPFDGIIEGHFHIGKKLQIHGINYLALPAFYFTHKGISIKTLID